MYACIDLGSNSFHLLIAEWQDGEIQLIERCSEKVQLGEGSLASGVISAPAFERGLQCLEHFKKLIRKQGVQRYWALGTNTFRITDNAASFIDAARTIGIKISIISGVQEAVLIYAGVIAALKDNEKQRLVIDIGGGSTELIVGQRRQRLITHSLPVGCVSWRDRFFAAVDNTDINLLSRKLDEAIEAAADVFGEIAPGIDHFAWVNAYASSGTAKMLTAICQENGLGSGEFTLGALQQLRSEMLKAISKGNDLAGLKEKRRDLLLPGLAVMAGLMQALSVESIIFSPSALREGMLDFMVNNRDTMHVLAPDNLPDVTYAGN